MKKYPLICGIVGSCIMVVAIILNIVAKFFLLMDSVNGLYPNSSLSETSPMLVVSQILSYVSIVLVLVFAIVTLCMIRSLDESKKLVKGLMIANLTAAIAALIAMIVSIFTTFFVQFIANSLIVITIVTTFFAFQKIQKCGEYYHK